MVLQVQTPEQVTAQIDAEKEARLEAMKAAYKSNPVTDELASHVRSMWEIAKFNRMELNNRLQDCQRRRAGEYEETKLQAIREQGGSEIYMQITSAKCRAAKAWLSDLFSPSGDRPWRLQPTPIPELPPAIEQQLVMQAVQGAMELGVPMEQVQAMVMKHRDRLIDELKVEAEERAERMSEKIEDLMVESGYREAFDEFLDDLVTYPFAVMKGIEFRRTKKLQWLAGEDGSFQPAMGQEIIPMVRRVSPFRCYPSPATGAKIDDHWVIEHHSFTRQDLVNMRGAPGYNSEAIAHVLNHYGLGGLREWIWDDEERDNLAGRFSSSADKELIDALEFSGRLSGRQLLDWGMTGQIDEFEEYPVSVMVVHDYVIRALLNPDPAGKPDYHKACWSNVPGNFAGIALPESLADCQDTCNAAARSLINNMGMSSGPQVWVETDRLAAGEDISVMHPWKIWQTTTGAGAGSGNGIGFFQPASNASELMTIYERFSRYADDISGLPAYAYGSDQAAGAGKTASGLSMLMNAASKTIKHVVRNVDIYVIEPVVEKFYNFVMLTSDDEMLKGDCVPHARGSEALIHKESATMRQQELLAMTANPIDMQIIGLDGRREQLREVFKSGDIPVDRIIPTKEEMQQRAEEMAAAAQQQQMQAQPQQ